MGNVYQKNANKIEYFKRIGVRFYDTMPEGWHIAEGATTAPIGYAWINNGKPRFTCRNDYEHGLLKVDEPEWFIEGKKNIINITN